MIGELLQFGSFSRRGAFWVSDLSSRKIYQKHLLLLGSRIGVESDLFDFKKHASVCLNGQCS
ncbi:MAG: hypothetical protein COB51_09250 [Moraxellaceae bacterium]|nr:MAG: hypothetical protein COB51_09250 [Moraxellaceae bacterium]